MIMCSLLGFLRSVLRVKGNGLNDRGPMAWNKMLKTIFGSAG